MVGDDGSVRSLAEQADWLLIPDVVRRQVAVSGSCIVWRGRVDEAGHGVIGVGEARLPVEAVVWCSANEFKVRRRRVVQVCSNLLCVKPSHLAGSLMGETTTTCAPAVDGMNPRTGRPLTNPAALKTECLRGHPYDEANTYVDRNGHRSCRACAREYQRQRQRSAPVEVEPVGPMSDEDRARAEAHSTPTRDPLMAGDWSEPRPAA